MTGFHMARNIDLILAIHLVTKEKVMWKKKYLSTKNINKQNIKSEAYYKRKSISLVKEK